MGLHTDDIVIADGAYMYFARTILNFHLKINSEH